MKEGIKTEIKLLHAQLKNKSSWYLDFQCPDEDHIQDLVGDAMQSADYELSKLSESALYNRFMRWREESKIESPDTYVSFLSDVAFDLALQSIDKEDRPIFDESVNIYFRWL